MKLKWILALLTGALAIGVYAGDLLATPQAGVTATQLAKGTFDQVYMGFDSRRSRPEGPSDVYVIQNAFAPGATTGWHTHPGPSLIMVTAGQITAYDPDNAACAPKVYKAGDTIADVGGGHVHMLVNATSAAAQTVAVQVIPKDAPRRIDAPAPAGCA